MKRNWKLIYIVAGIAFALEVLAGIRGLWNIQSDVGLSSLTLPIILYRILVFTLLSVWAFRGKKRGRLLNVLGLVYFAIVFVNHWNACSVLGSDAFRTFVYNGTPCSYLGWIWSVTAFVLTRVGQPQQEQKRTV